MSIPKHFFAAANGYTGFRSYFDSVFCSEDYDKIYVIKGGPGPGKSSFMKKLSSYFAEREVITENIHCSSDPDSLDGVVLEKDGKRVGLLDGTAPHERDAIVPGAIDELINLGANWDTRWLKAQKNKILELNKEKKSAYKTAYSYLNIAGMANTKIVDKKKKACDLYLLKVLIKSVAETTSELKSVNVSTRLISGFGKRGVVKFDTLNSMEYKHFSIQGDKEAGYIFINELIKMFSEFKSNITRFPCPLDDKKYEAVILHDTGLCFDVFGNGEEINTLDFFSENKVNAEQIKAMEVIEEDALKHAERWFNVASEIHSELEEIYSKSMNFDKNNLLYEEKRNEICDILLI